MTEGQPRQADALVSALEGVDEKEYGANYREHSLEIYKMYVEMADRISQRRDKANSFFLAVNAALIALLSKDAFGSTATRPALIEFLIPASAVVICYVWYRLLKSYRDMNSAKFKVIYAIERQLPLRPYDAEWESVERGTNPSLYLSLTRIERVVPGIFMAFYAVLAIAASPLWGDCG